MATSMPTPQEQPSFLAATRAFCKLLYQIGSPKVKAAAFLFENTMCYQEFDSSKRITLDEFVNGRKRKDGSRLSPGCGLKQRSHVSEALHELETQHFISVLIDDHDSARQRKFYRLSLPSLDQCPENRDTLVLPVPESGTPTPTPVPKSGTVILPSVPKSGTQSSPNRNTEFRNREPDQSKYLKKVPKESTYNAADRETVELASIAPSARASSEARREDVLTLSEKGEDEPSPLEPAEEHARLQNYLERLKAIDPARLSRIDQITLRNRIRRTERALEDLSTLSCSPAPAIAPPSEPLKAPSGAWLSENEQVTIETRTPEPTALFPEAVPPAPVERPFAVVARLFFREDVTITNNDAKEIQSVVNVLHEHGVDDPWRIEELHTFWRDRYRDLKRKTMYHFKRYAFQTAQGGA